jgi:hypothetical protein
MPTARKDHLSRQSRSFIFAGQPCRLARHEPAHCIVVDDQVPEPDPIASFPVTVATWPKRWNAKSTMPRRLIWPEASNSVSPAELTRPPGRRCGLRAGVRLIPEGRPANRSLSAIEPVSATAKRKLENGEQRPAPETFPARAEIPKITDQRLGRASLTRGNVAGSHTPGNNTPETGLPG